MYYPREGHLKSDVIKSCHVLGNQHWKRLASLHFCACCYGKKTAEWNVYNIYIDSWSTIFFQTFSSFIRLSVTALKKVTRSCSELARSRDTRISSKAGQVKQRCVCDSIIVSSLKCLQNWQSSVSFLYLDGKFPRAGNISPLSLKTILTPSRSRVEKYFFLSNFSSFHSS